jgi:6-pyruvoyltetrahydropterin/6-carboxytetrahydropterin synthase
LKVKVSRKAHFNAAHRLHNPSLTSSENEELFGKCNNPNWHGHNYEVIANVKGEIDPKTGYVIDMKELKDIMNQEVIDRFDHRNLNLDVDDFQDLNPTAENIAVVIWNRLRKRLDNNLELSIILYETERNFVEYDGE